MIFDRIKAEKAADAEREAAALEALARRVRWRGRAGATLDELVEGHSVLPNIAGHGVAREIALGAARRRLAVLEERGRVVRSGDRWWPFGASPVDPPIVDLEPPLVSAQSRQEEPMPEPQPVAVQEAPSSEELLAAIRARPGGTLAELTGIDPKSNAGKTTWSRAAKLIRDGLVRGERVGNFVHYFPAADVPTTAPTGPPEQGRRPTAKAVPPRPEQTSAPVAVAPPSGRRWVAAPSAGRGCELLVDLDQVVAAVEEERGAWWWVVPAAGAPEIWDGGAIFSSARGWSGCVPNVELARQIAGDLAGGFNV